MSSLRAELKRVKAEITEQESALLARLDRLPAETAKAAFTAIIPAVLGTEIASALWKMAKGVFEWIGGAKEGEEPAWKSTLLGGASKLGLFSGLKLLLSLWKGK